ncbi:ERCC4 domain-containing protein [Xylaria intraflava]|nr:ERCC4 domain-containing protein [Xylaria intraflava]
MHMWPSNIYGHHVIKTQSAPILYTASSSYQDPSAHLSPPQKPRMPTEVIMRTKRRASYQPRHNDNDFLFSDDDFDTTGDLDSNLCKKPRTSSASYRKAKSTTIGPSFQKQPQPVGIEFSSSPVAPPASELARRNARETTSDLFPSSWDEKIRKDQPLKEFIDLSGDPIESPPQRKAPSNTLNSRLDAAWDPISSSAHESHDIQDLLSSPAAGGANLHSPPSILIDGDSGSDDSDDLPDLGEVDFSKIRARKRSSNSSRFTARTSGQNTRRVAQSTEEKEREKKQRLAAKEAEKKQKLAAKEAEKAQKRVEKERAKEERALQKALIDVNKTRTDKNVSVSEMIVDVPASINPFLKVQIEAVLDDIGAERNTWASTVEHVVKWRRKVTSQFNKDKRIFEPTPMHIEDEDHVMVIIRASEFVKFMLGEEGRDLETHVLQMTTKFPNAKLIYLIEGLTTWMRKNRNLLNRQFASAVRNFGAAKSELSPPRRRNNNEHQEYVDEDRIEDALLSLQVVHGTLIHHTNVPIETAQWVGVFTRHIGTIPYRKARDANADAGFCMEAGQVRTGDGLKDTYIQMLQKITRVTPPIAYGIAAKYESVTKLIRGFEEEGPLALAECYRGANKDGSLTDRTIGPALSKRVYKIFMGRDPTSTDV